MFRVKICGITNERDAVFACEYGADALGFIFYQKSPRKISVPMCREISKKVHPFVLKAGVFVDEEKEKVLEVIKKCRLQAVQFHGEETPQYCQYFKKQILVIKSFCLKDEADLEKMKRYDVDGWLVDTYDPFLKGGTGRPLNFALAKKASLLKRPVILSGGLSVENAAFYLEKIKPDAVDIASGIERKPGVKNLKKTKEFIAKVKNYAAK